jgi:hypothetical protein
MAANAGSDSETYHEVPASKYWYLGDTIGAVPKGFFKFFTSFVIIVTAASTAIACLTNWWQQVLAAIFIGRFWYVGWLLVLVAVIVILFKSRRGVKQQK